jgi:hypothetical protein
MSICEPEQHSQVMLVMFDAQEFFHFESLHKNYDGSGSVISALDMARLIVEGKAFAAIIPYTSEVMSRMDWLERMAAEPRWDTHGKTPVTHRTYRFEDEFGYYEVNAEPSYRTCADRGDFNVYTYTLLKPKKDQTDDVVAHT